AAHQGRGTVGARRPAPRRSGARRDRAHAWPRLRDSPRLTMDFKDYYSILGVSKTASDKDLKQAFRKMARKFHPDVNPGDKAAEAKFKEINEAYEVLGDPDKRKKYDELGANWRAYENVPPGAGFGGQPEWNVRFGGQSAGGGYRTMTEEEMREMFGDGSPFSYFFQTFCGGGAGAAFPHLLLPPPALPLPHPLPTP